MPAAYAHITLVNELFQTPRLNKIKTFTKDAKTALRKNHQYCEIGCISPDYPYLHFEDTGSKEWADIMHKHKIGELIKRGIEYTKGLSGKERDQAFAWMLGFAAHVLTDVCIHPVVEKRVGPYEKFPRDHRKCEMHQDFHIFKRMKLGGIEISNFLELQIARCDIRPVEKVWSSILKDVYPDVFKNNEPHIADWHKRFETVVEDIAAHGYKLIYFGRHILQETGVLYPDEANLDASYLTGLKTPESPADYNAIFDRATAVVSRFWADIADAVFAGGTAYINSFGNWNLDRGVPEDELARSGRGKYVFWEGTCEKA